MVSGKRTPSQEIVQLKEELAEERSETKAKWMKIGRSIAYALTAGLAAYGAGRPSGETEGKEAKAQSSMAYEESVKAIADLQRVANDHALRLQEMKKYQDSALERLAVQSNMELQKTQKYVEGYLAGVGGKVRVERVDDMQSRVSALRLLETARSEPPAAKAAKPTEKLMPLQQIINQSKE